jgi:enamine deaminase RidA (YjgF/YER057c/UK114 family)
MTRRNIPSGSASAEAVGPSAGFENVIRTRMFVTDIARWEEVGRVQVASLVRPDLLVEIEATALVPEDSL